MIRSLPLKDLNIIEKEGSVIVDPDKIVLAESSNPQTNNSAFLDLSISAEEGDEDMLIKFRFVNKGDGDQLGVWINDEMAAVITGSSAGNESRFTNFGFGGNSTQLVTFALHAYGEVNSKVEINNITIASISPELFSELKKAYEDFKDSKPLKDFKIEKNPTNEPLKIVNVTKPSALTPH